MIFTANLVSVIGDKKALKQKQWNHFSWHVYAQKLALGVFPSLHPILHANQLPLKNCDVGHLAFLPKLSPRPPHHSLIFALHMLTLWWGGIISLLSVTSRQPMSDLGSPHTIGGWQSGRISPIVFRYIIFPLVFWWCRITFILWLTRIFSGIIFTIWGFLFLV